MKAFNQRAIQPILEVAEVNKQLFGLEQEIGKHETAIKQLNLLIKEIAKNKRKSIQQIVGGNLVMDMSGDDAIKVLQERKEQIEIGLKSMNEQHMHRQDTMSGLLIQIYKMTRNRIDSSIIKDIDESMPVG
jgi:chaperonin cofactor prefoldin